MLKIAIVQHVIRWNELEWNLQHITSLLNRQPGADLYVLAETFATGFLAEGSAEKAGLQAPQIVCWMKQQARRLDAAIAGSVAMVDEDGLSPFFPATVATMMPSSMWLTGLPVVVRYGRRCSRPVHWRTNVLWWA